jgi:hypothetical protein
MAFGKKKDEAAATEAQAGSAEALAVPAPDAVSDPPTSLPMAETAAAADTTPPVDAVDAVAGAEGDPAVAAPADALANPDALLSAFQTTQVEAEDHSVLLDLAGEHNLAGLLDDLHTVAAALGIVLDDDYEDEDAA